MVEYIAAGTFPDTWKDLVPVDPSLKVITITSGKDAVYRSCFEEGIDKTFYEDDGDGFIDFYLAGEIITEEIAKDIIAKVNHTISKNVLLMYTEVPYNYTIDDIDGVSSGLKEADKNLESMMLEDD